jgi:hypothetical protein
VSLAILEGLVACYFEVGGWLMKLSNCNNLQSVYPSDFVNLMYVNAKSNISFEIENSKVTRFSDTAGSE